MNYYIVTAKCGHVGKVYYIPIDFHVMAESKTEAAKITRSFPRVKQHHKGAILCCREVSIKEYNAIREKNHADTYLSCHSSSEQKRCCDIENRIVEEIKNKKEPQFNRKDKISYLMKKRKIVEKDCLYQCKLLSIDSEEVIL